MTMTKSIPLLFSFHLFFLLHPSPSSADTSYHICGNTGNYTANSTYATNLNQTLSSLPTSASRSSGFSKSTFGSGSNQAFALAICRGDTNSSSCLSCLDIAIQEAPQLCPYYKSVTIYYAHCILSYSSNQTFLDVFAPSDFPQYFCDDSGKYTANGTYAANLNRLLSFLPANASLSSGFSKSTFGSGSNQVSGLALCRGDTDTSSCHSCLHLAIQEALQLCPYVKSVTIYYELCLLRYSNQIFLSSTDNSDEILFYNTQNITDERFAGWDPKSAANHTFFNSVIYTLLTNIADLAANHSTSRFATGEINITNAFPTLYGLVQCTPDLSNGQCHECLQDLIKEMIEVFDGSTGARILGVRCNVRYETYTFYDVDSMVKISSLAPIIPIGNSPAPPPSTMPRSPPGSSPPSPVAPPSGGKSKLWIIITTTSLALLFSFALLCFLWIKRKRRAREEKKRELQREFNITTNEASRRWKNEDSNSKFSLYNFSQIADATNHFSPENKLGEGGFGPVYKGQLPDRLEIAAKRLSARSGQGQVEFKNEIQLIAKLQHRNLVSLIGCCIEGEEKILIYEYMPNKSLDFFLFDQTKGALLDWSKRFHIIEGIAQGLLYLHKHSRLRIIHRDLKASNILLDRDMNPKISDFGMARIFGSNENQANTNRIVGTYGYMSPEYAFEGLFSIKSDVFSFGVLLLEIVSGKRNAGFYQFGNSVNLLGYAWELWKEGKWFELIDASLGDGYDKVELERSINIALMCVQENAVDRPTMSNVITMLSNDSPSLPDPKQPAFFNLRIATEAEELLNLTGTCSVNDVTITTPYGR
ncbi:cysteine-rich receptor-like protein kinase 19 [Typha angustifolia]|uniref:cysteine-rich receptor-like protein kinase 19 n=1 Tax=Typha angustifolia TaxID=59011 RepID=UPI003C30C8A0